MVYHNFPGRNARIIRSELNRVFEDMFGSQAEESESVGNLTPLVDIEENDRDFRLYAELPGMEKKDVKITFQGNNLCLSGQKNKVGDSPDSKILRTEREYGTFSRTFTIPADVDAEKISAEFKNGVLCVVLPKAEEARPQEIRIS